MKLVWLPVHGQPLWRKARCSFEYEEPVSTTPTGLRDTDLDPVQDWCVANWCGVRMSFDTFKFRNEKELALFLLRWS
jgi:hypothetical protein